MEGNGRIAYASMVKFLYALTVTGFLVVFATWFAAMYTTASVAALSAGFGLVFFALLVAAYTKYAYVLGPSGSSGMRLALAMGPYAIVAVSVGFVLYYLSKYFRLISDNHTSSYFNSFFTVFTVLLAAQLFTLYKDTRDRAGDALIVFLGTINLVLVVTMGIVLEHYTTQGFALRPRS
jgi:hypothetical protein